MNAEKITTKIAEKHSNSPYRSLYRGRFAPSPSGALHFGSLLTALASYLDARAHAGVWLLRLEDVDRERCQRRYADRICQQLERYHLEWQGEIRVQSEHRADYEDVLATLRPQLYACACSRKQWQDGARLGPLGAIYPRYCREQHRVFVPDMALRLALPAGEIRVCDRLRGSASYAFADLGDPILRRHNGDIAYHLAVCCDDALQGITHIVRGRDLLVATALHAHLQNLMHWQHPDYLHLPLALDRQKRKISKHEHRLELADGDERARTADVRRALRFLGQTSPPDELNLDETLNFAVQHWQWRSIPRQDACAE